MDMTNIILRVKVFLKRKHIKENFKDPKERSNALHESIRRVFCVVEKKKILT